MNARKTLGSSEFYGPHYTSIVLKNEIVCLYVLWDYLEIIQNFVYGRHGRGANGMIFRIRYTTQGFCVNYF